MRPKPCPFCGEEVSLKGASADGVFAMICLWCGCVGPNAKGVGASAMQALHFWNVRDDGKPIMTMGEKGACNGSKTGAEICQEEEC